MTLIWKMLVRMIEIGGEVNAAPPKNKELELFFSSNERGVCQMMVDFRKAIFSCFTVPGIFPLT